MSEPHIHYYGKEGVSFSGKEAVEVCRVATLISAIKLSGKTGMVITRGFTLTKGLKMATTYTKVQYKRTEWQKAVDDLTAWMELMKSTIPTTVEKDGINVDQ